MCNILIAGYDSDTGNYQRQLQEMQVSYHTMSDIDFSYFLESIEAYDGLLLPGGGDISPDSLFDLQQFWILHAFVQMRKPVLGICKGMQLINLYFGGTLYPDLYTWDIHNHDSSPQYSIIHSYDSIHQCDRIHDTYALPDTYLARLYGTHFQTNSAHHQGCALLGRGLLPAQYSVDCVLEGFYHTSLPIFGVQWHPERTSISQASLSSIIENNKEVSLVDGSALFQYFLS